MNTDDELEYLNWHTESRLVDDLLPWAGNPRRMGKKQIEDLKQSLGRLNLMSIPVVNTDNTIVSGHQRIKVLHLLGRGQETIDVRVPNRSLTAEELREANLRENKNLGEWNWDALAEIGKEELLDVGFSDDELAMGFGLNDAESEVLEDDASLVLRIDPPEAVMLREEAVICFDSKNDYDRVKAAVLEKKINAGSLISLLTKE